VAHFLGLHAAYAVPVALVIYRLDLFEREPKLMLAAALAWGGVIAPARDIRERSVLSVWQAHLAGLRRSVGSSYRGPRRRGTLK